MEKSVINFMFFGMNYRADFIKEVWKDDPLLIDHLVAKFNALYSQYGSFAFYAWFFELSTDHKIKLIKWIDQNYCSGF